MRIDGLGFTPDIAHRPQVSKAEPKQAAGEIKSVLSSDELNYFAEMERLGPVTYGRRGAKPDQTTPPAALGQRIDIRA